MIFPVKPDLVAEAIGTMLLVATVTGSGVMATRLTPDPGLQLLCNALATGSMLVVLISIFAPISGAHFNPLVTLVMKLRRRINFRTSMCYVLAQLAGGIAGIMATHLMFDVPMFQIATKYRAGTGLWASEIIASAGLILTIMLVENHAREKVPLLVGLYVTAAYWFTASTSFVNPAVTVARALTDSFAGIYPGDVPAFICAQLVGGMIGLGVGVFLLTGIRDEM